MGSGVVLRDAHPLPTLGRVQSPALILQGNFLGWTVETSRDVGQLDLSSGRGWVGVGWKGHPGSIADILSKWKLFNDSY